MFKIINNADGDERELTELEKALLSRALNTEMNTIMKLMDLDEKYYPDADQKVFNGQYEVVHNLYEAVYDIPETLAQYLRRT